jgi:hypothetical protein
MYKNSLKLEQKRGRFSTVLLFENALNALTSNDVQRGCHDVFRGHQKAKIRAKIARNRQKTAAFLSMALA